MINRRTRKLLLNIATGVALAATAAVVFVPAAAVAAPATVTTNANLRDGPGGSVIGTARRGDIVDVVECGGSWCELDDGSFISRSLLSMGGGDDVGLGISIGPGGVSVGVGVGGGPRPGGRPPIIIDEDEELAEVCFYERTRFRGDSFCVEEGETMNRLRDWDERIASIENPDGLRVTVCAERNLRDCRTYTSSARSLGDFEDTIRSLRVR